MSPERIAETRPMAEAPLLELIKRVEGARDGSRELNRLIEIATQIGAAEHHDRWMTADGYVLSTDSHPEYGGAGRGGRQAYLPPPFTTNVSAAFALVERLASADHPGWTHNHQSTFDRRDSWHWFEVTWPSHEIRGRGYSLALAACSVALRVALLRTLARQPSTGEREEEGR